MGTQKSNLIYRLRQKGLKIDTETHIIYVTDINQIESVQIKKLRSIYNFRVQMIF